MRKTGLAQGREVIDGTHREAMAYVARWSLFRGQIRIILGSGRLEHRRAEIGRIAEVLRKRIVGEECPPSSKPASDVDITGFIPALRGILQEVDPAHRKSCVGNGDVRRQAHARQKAKDLEWPARPNRSWPGRSVINKMRTLQVHSVR